MKKALLTHLLEYPYIINCSILQKNQMSSWGNIGRPLIIVITVALASAIVVSSFLVYIVQQTIESNIAQVASQTLQDSLAEDAKTISNRISLRLASIESGLSDSALAISGKDPTSNSVRQTLLLTKSRFSGYTDDIVWVSSEGKLLYATNGNVSDQLNFDPLSKLSYNLQTERNATHISSVLTDILRTPSIAVAAPVLRSAIDGSFEGVLAAIIPINSTENIFLAPYESSNKSLLLVSRDGTILAHSSSMFVGKNILEDNGLLSLISDDTRDQMKDSLQLMTQGSSGVVQYKDKDGHETLMAYEPIMVNGRHVWTVGVTEPTFVVLRPFLNVFMERENFNLVTTSLLAAIAAIFVVFTLVFNRRLFTTVNKQNEKISRQLSELSAAYDRLKEQEVIKDEFINIAAHELRTPVLPIVLSAENLADSMPDDNNVRIILRNSNRITKLTNDILDVSRIESNTFKLQKQKTNLLKLIEEVIQDAQLKMAEEQKVQIIFENRVSSEMGDLVIDRGRINQVLVNLVDNAVNFTESGIIRIVLEMETADRIKISVIDSGKGIDPSIVPKLFGKFVTKSERAKGTGLGLYLCKAIVEAHGGTISGNNNARGAGATFSLTLPVS
jgi:signal transduction histidine kinase